jgi:eukaryotic-like serine/threonine-protein kinase
MTEQRATAPAPQNEEDGELTAHAALSSGKRLKASAVASTDARESSREAVTVDVLEEHVAFGTPSGATPAPTRLGPYQIVCELAAGGMATVYLALYRSIEGFEKLCAVKRIHPHLASARELTNMFADEAQIAARISHPFVCGVFSFGRSQQSHFIAMEFLRGEPLSVVSRRVAAEPELGNDPRFPAIAARLLANFAEGLHAAHELRDEHGALLEVVHRDVTPHNLFVLYDGTVRVTDFGIARARRRLHQSSGRKLKGKLGYVAPEQLNEGKVDLRVDVWGLGVTLWELLAGRRLFLAASEAETLAAVTSRVVAAPSTYRASVPAELDRIVLRALERDVDLRYRSARDFARDLEKFLIGIGDTVPAMDVADWMATVCPEGGERIQALVESAARVSAATADDTVVRVPSSSPSRDLSAQPSSEARPEPALSLWRRLGRWCSQRWR